MLPPLRCLVLLLVVGSLWLVAAAGLRAGALGRDAEQSTVDQSMDEPFPEQAMAMFVLVDDDITTGSIDPAARRLPLSEEDRGRIFEGVMHLRNAPTAEVEQPASSAPLPDSVALQDLPAQVTDDVPAVQGYKFVKLDDRILLVSPVDRTVVNVIPRYKLILD
jgi:hypothetical protein